MMKNIGEVCKEIELCYFTLIEDKIGTLKDCMTSVHMAIDCFYKATQLEL